MTDLTSLREDMEIVGSDGRHVGEIDHVQDDGQIKLKRKDSEAQSETGVGQEHHHFIPVDWVERVDAAANRAELSLTRDEAEARWRHEH